MFNYVERAVNDRMPVKSKWSILIRQGKRYGVRHKNAYSHLSEHLGEVS